MERNDLRGVGPALVTPMHEDGSVDFDAFERHVEYVMEGGVHFLVPCGTTGESATLDAGEQREVIEACVRAAAGRVPVMAGAGANATAKAAKLAAAARDAGADAILSVSPYYNKPTQAGLVEHYRAVADAAEIPVIVYNVPGRTGSNVQPATLLRLAREVENVWGVKEASGDIDQVMTILRERPEEFLVLSGEDHLTFAMMALGGDGLISVVANEAPALVSSMVDDLLAGDFDGARPTHYRLLPLMRRNFIETNPIPVKTALAMMGRMDAHFRPPLVALEKEHREPLREALEEAGVLGGAGESAEAARAEKAGAPARAEAAS